MSNILDYISWRGDLPFTASPFNEIDALILSQIAYINFDGLLASSFEAAVPLRELAKKFASAPDYEARSDLGALISELTTKLFFEAAQSERFGGVGACGYANKIDVAEVKQFSAMTFVLGDRHAFVAFRGTDDTIVGWNEDFNMGVLETVPAQQDALKYLTEALGCLRGQVDVGGHSKGGNLAIFSGASVAKKHRKRIGKIYNNDGPGFSEKNLSSENFVEAAGKVRSFYPQFSVVGMLFSHAGESEVVESDEKGIMQHDPFSWHVGATSFKTLPGFDSGSRVFHKTFNSWFSALDEERRRQFVDTLFMLIQATDARTNSELEKNLVANSAKIIRAMLALEAETKTELAQTMKMLFQIASKNLPELELFSDGRHRKKTGK